MKTNSSGNQVRKTLYHTLGTLITSVSTALSTIVKDLKERVADVSEELYALKVIRESCYELNQYDMDQLVDLHNSVGVMRVGEAQELLIKTYNARRFWWQFPMDINNIPLLRWCAVYNCYKGAVYIQVPR
jgi:hypothetical protein